MQTILGAGGAIGTELAKALSAYTSEIRLVSRQPKKINDNDELLAADITDPAQVAKAVVGSSVCYLTIGLPYKTKVWQQQWPMVIQHVVAACVQHQCKLIFFDNVYAIDGQHLNPITENSPLNPSSRKGEVRAAVDRHILEHVEKGKLDAIIARSPDFYGPVKDQSLLMTVIYNNLINNKAPQWFCNADVTHTCGYTPELAKGTAMLGNTPTAFNQVWNLPVDPSPITGRQWAELFAEVMNVNPRKIQVLPGWGIKLLGMFIPVLGEMYEMRYQYDREYFFDSSKFNRNFQYAPITHRDAVAETIKQVEKKIS